MDKQRILITGASGFAGRKLVSHFAASGWSVIASARRDIADWAHDHNVETLIGDLATIDQLPENVTAVIHAAATSPQHGIPAGAIVRDNVTATNRLVDAARRAKVGRFILLSSISAFGRVERPVLDETTPSIDPDLYGLTKKIGEELLAAASSDLSALALRLPGLVGPNASRNWLTRIKADILAGRPIQAYNLDAPFNNAVHIDDLCAFVATLATADFHGFDMMVLGAADSVPIGTMLERFMHVLGRSVPLHEMQKPQTSFQIDIGKATGIYRYNPLTIDRLLRKYAADGI